VGKGAQKWFNAFTSKWQHNLSFFLTTAFRGTFRFLEKELVTTS
jgi:hypothetical protein